jgi:hypothetical protein
MSIDSLHPAEAASQATVAPWQRRLDVARDVAEVVEITRDFLAAFHPADLHALPTACWPPARIRDGADVAAYAFELIRHECSAPRTAHLMRQLASFLSHASGRIARLSTPITDEEVASLLRPGSPARH